MKEALRSLLALIILAGFLEMLLPEDQMRKYSRMVLGLLVLFSLLQLIVTAGKEFSLEMLAGDLGLPGEKTAAATDRFFITGRRVREAGAEKAGSTIKERLERKVSAVVQEISGRQEVRTELVISGGRVSVVRVYLGPSGSGKSINVAGIKNVVGELLKISPQLVEVEKTGEGGR